MKSNSLSITLSLSPCLFTLIVRKKVKQNHIGAFFVLFCFLSWKYMEQNLVQSCLYGNHTQLTSAVLAS